MTDAAKHRGEGDRPGQPENGAGDDLQALRALLLGREQQRLARLEKRLEDPAARAEEIGDALPQAVRQRMARDDQLAKALAPTIEESFQVSVKRNPRVLVDVIAPIMGPAIRTSIMQAINGMVQSLNHTLEQSFSKQGLKWRIEAMRTGKSFAEVVLVHTLVYQVEQVFLIHRETGLLLQHVSAVSVQASDADMVSGMLTAIQDFVHDSFGGDRDSGVNTMQVGERTVWVERGSDAVVACVLRGSPPEGVRRMLHEALESVQIEMKAALESFDGQSEAFEASRPVLEECLQSQFKTDREDAADDASPVEDKRRSLVPWIVLGAVAVIAGHWVYGVLDERSRWEAYVESLRAEPGIVVVEADERDDGYFISGLRDPLARDPAALLQERALAADRIQAAWEPYLSFVPEFVAQRSRQLLKPPDTVELRLEADRLRALGGARHAWIEEAGRLVTILPGVSAFDTDELTDLDRVDFERLRSELEATVILFGTGVFTIERHQEQQLTRLRDKIIELFRVGDLVGLEADIHIAGHTDDSGSADLNRQLGEARAGSVRDRLRELGIPGDRISAGLAARGARVAAVTDRRVVTFAVRTGA